MFACNNQKTRIPQGSGIITLGSCACEILTLHVLFVMDFHLHLNMKQTAWNTHKIPFLAQKGRYFA